MKKIAGITILCWATLLFLHSPVCADQLNSSTGHTTVSSDASVDQDTYIRDGDLTINPGATLVVDDNATLTFDSGYKIDKKQGGKIVKKSAAVTCYVDSDGDSYGTGAGTFSSGSCPSGYASRGGDCCDSDNKSYPGASADWAWGYQANACGSYDRNCDGIVEKYTKYCYTVSNCTLSGGAGTCGGYQQACANLVQMACGASSQRYSCDFSAYSSSCTVGIYGHFGITDTEIAGSAPNPVCKNQSQGGGNSGYVTASRGTLTGWSDYLCYCR